MPASTATSDHTERAQRVGKLLNDRLQQGLLLLHEHNCPSCETQLVMIERNPDDATCDAITVASSTSILDETDIDEHKNSNQPVPGVPFCVVCEAHVINDPAQVQYLMGASAVAKKSATGGLAHKGAILVATPSTLDIAASSSGDGSMTVEEEVMVELFQAASMRSTLHEEIEIALAMPKEIEDVISEGDEEGSFDESPIKSDPSSTTDSTAQDSKDRLIELLEDEDEEQSVMNYSESVLSMLEDDTPVQNDTMENLFSASDGEEIEVMNYQEEDAALADASSDAESGGTPILSQPGSPMDASFDKEAVAPADSTEDTFIILAHSQDSDALSPFLENPKQIETAVTSESEQNVNKNDVHLTVETEDTDIRDEDLVDFLPEYSVRRDLATKVLGAKMLQGFALKEDLCNSCSMPLMEKDEQVECVVCPFLRRRALKSKLAQDDEKERQLLAEQKATIEEKANKILADAPGNVVVAPSHTMVTSPQAFHDTSVADPIDCTEACSENIQTTMDELEACLPPHISEHHAATPRDQIIGNGSVKPNEKELLAPSPSKDCVSDSIANEDTTTGDHAESQKTPTHTSEEEMLTKWEKEAAVMQREAEEAMQRARAALEQVKIARRGLLNLTPKHEGGVNEQENALASNDLTGTERAIVCEEIDQEEKEDAADAVASNSDNPENPKPTGTESGAPKKLDLDDSMVAVPINVTASGGITSTGLPEEEQTTQQKEVEDVSEKIDIGRKDTKERSKSPPVSVHTECDKGEELKEVEICMLGSTIKSPKDPEEEKVRRQWENLRTEGRLVKARRLLSGWKEVTETCKGKHCDASLLLWNGQKTECMVCGGNGNGADGLYEEGQLKEKEVIHAEETRKNEEKKGKSKSKARKRHHKQQVAKGQPSSPAFHLNGHGPAKLTPISPSLNRSVRELQEEFESKRGLVSKEIGKRMIRGWTLLDLACPYCIMPLMTDKRGIEEICVLCGVVGKHGDSQSISMPLVNGKIVESSTNGNTKGHPETLNTIKPQPDATKDEKLPKADHSVPNSIEVQQVLSKSGEKDAPVDANESTVLPWIKGLKQSKNNDSSSRSDPPTNDEQPKIQKKTAIDAEESICDPVRNIAVYQPKSPVPAVEESQPLQNKNLNPSAHSSIGVPTDEEGSTAARFPVSQKDANDTIAKSGLDSENIPECDAKNSFERKVDETSLSGYDSKKDTLTLEIPMNFDVNDEASLRHLIQVARTNSPRVGSSCRPLPSPGMDPAVAPNPPLASPVSVSCSSSRSSSRPRITPETAVRPRSRQGSLRSPPSNDASSVSTMVDSAAMDAGMPIASSRFSESRPVPSMVRTKKKHSLPPLSGGARRMATPHSHQAKQSTSHPDVFVLDNEPLETRSVSSQNSGTGSVGSAALDALMQRIEDAKTKLEVTSKPKRGGSVTGSVHSQSQLRDLIDNLAKAAEEMQKLDHQ